MQRFYRILSYIIFGLNGLMIFFWFFIDDLVIPPALQIMGRMHPLLLHLPIGFFVVSVILLLVRSQFKKKSFQKTYELVLSLTAATLVVTSLMGIILSREGGYDEGTLKIHLNLGVLVSLVSASLVGIPLSKRLSKPVYMFTAAGFIVLVITGHFGATLTHGENYVLAPLMKTSESKINTDSLTVFKAAIFPVLEKKCLSCHNPKKKKGELLLTDEENILKGGENGLVLIPGKPSESEILKRVHLDMEHDDHMPPSGKPQLTINEILLITTWIDRGAEFKKYWSAYPQTDSIKILGEIVLASYQQPKQKQYNFDFASGDKIKNLNTPFRNVSQLSADAPALKADFYLAQFFKAEDLKDLSEIKPQLVELNLAGMPVSDKDVEYIAQFKNLESLNLNNTGITDEAFDDIITLSNLEKLSVAGTKISTAAFKKISEIKNLKEVYLWNTLASPTQVDELKSKLPAIQWNTGFQADEKEKLKLTPPILKNETFILGDGDKIILKHNLPGTQIRYTLDGTSPDSVNGVIYAQPISISTHTILKTIATKDEWFKSNETEHRFYKKGIAPLQVKLTASPHKDYKANGSTILTDNQIGDPNSFREGTWLGFKENKFESSFQFENATPLKEITILYNKNIGSTIMPPKEIEIWGGEIESTIKLIKKISPEQPSKYEPNKVEAITTSIDCPCSIIKIIATPVGKLPSWHSKKGEKGMVMVGEVIFH